MITFMELSHVRCYGSVVLVPLLPMVDGMGLRVVGYVLCFVVLLMFEITRAHCYVMSHLLVCVHMVQQFKCPNSKKRISLAKSSETRDV